MRKKRGVLVGCGYFAGIHMPAWRRLGEQVEIAACCDVERERAERLAGEFGIARTYTDFGAMLDAERPDFVDIVTRPALHEEMTMMAADRGIGVLCQKPLAPDEAGAERMVAYCEQKGVVLMANENWRWQAWYREMKRLMEGGVIGQPFAFTLRHRTNDGVGVRPYPRQPYFKDMPRLLLVETMIHFVDTARFLMGELQLRQAVLGRVNPHILGDDVVTLLLESADGAVGVVDGNRLSRPEVEGPVMGDARVEGELGTLSLAGDGRITVRPVEGEAYEHVYAIPEVGYRGDSAYQTLRHFVDGMESGVFETSGREYLKTTRLVFEGYRMSGWESKLNST